mmetsp:Transcript_85547/g.276036  ORF Transcript_85547/g.276036 Transcript_85547/m.276036 type:complete len:260 (+) Transcript_85547:388-1167(+)
MQPQEGRCRPHLRGYADRRGEHGEESVAYARHRRRLLPDWGAHSRIVSQAFCGEVCCDPVPWQTRTLGQVVRVGEIDQEAGRQTQGLAGNRKSDGRAARGGDGAAAAEGRTHMAQDSAWLPGTGGREARASRGLCGTIHLRACSSRIGSAGFGGVGERRRGEGAHCLRLLRHARAPEPGAAAALGRCPRGRRSPRSGAWRRSCRRRRCCSIRPCAASSRTAARTASMRRLLQVCLWCVYPSIATSTSGRHRSANIGKPE